MKIEAYNNIYLGFKNLPLFKIVVIQCNLLFCTVNYRDTE